VVLVAASGGGIRAAYWTASTLAAMDGVPGSSDNLFAISGVSGGSVGAATYAALQRERLVSGQADSVLPRARVVLAEDFLSPVVAGLLFPDLIQRFIPFPVAWAERQRFLERAWEAALGPTPNAFADAFTDLYAGGYQARLPSLLLNATVVDSGRRALVANMDVTSFTDLVDPTVHDTRVAREDENTAVMKGFPHPGPPP
jgi:predicted acylesterase/phospholipase RssA